MYRGAGVCGYRVCVQEGVYGVGVGWECEFVDGVCLSRYQCVDSQNGILVKSSSSSVESQ